MEHDALSQVPQQSRGKPIQPNPGRHADSADRDIDEVELWLTFGVPSFNFILHKRPIFLCLLVFQQTFLCVLFF